MNWKDPSKELPDYDVEVLTMCEDKDGELFAGIKHRSKRKGISRDKYGFAVYVPGRKVLGWIAMIITTHGNNDYEI